MKKLKNIQDSGTLIVLFVLIAIATLNIPEFGRTDNITSLLQSVTSVGLLACTMMFCLGTGDVDLSVGSICALGGTMAAVLVKHQGWSVPQAVGLALVTGAMIGLINGVVVAKLKVNALIATLASMQIVRGVAYLTAPNGSSVGISDQSFTRIAKWDFMNLQAPIWYMIIGFVLFGFLLSKTIFGRNMLATGGNQEAARLAGINADSVRIWIFSLQGLVAAFVGIVLASRVSSGQPSGQTGLELRVISACVLGGVSLTGGVASMVGVVSGVLIMGIVENTMSLKNIDTYWQYVVFGTVLLIAVIFDRLKAMRQK